MPETNPTPDWQALTDELLHNALDKLTQRARKRQASELGISSDFSDEVRNEEVINALCERAMGNLAEAYVFHLESFQGATDPQTALRHLEHAEVIWMSESGIIAQFDTHGGELQFLSKMRDQAYLVLANKLEEVTRTNLSTVTDAQIALVIGVVAVMDGILAEKGEPVQSPQRQQFRKIAKAFI